MSTIRVLFVCAGNTCRSPLAEDIARRLVPGGTFASAGVRAITGQPAEQSTIDVARDRGGDLTGHRARPVTRALVEAHDLVLVMEPWHRDLVHDLGGTGKTYLLDGDRQIEDPYGLPRDAYERTYDRLEAAIGTALDRLATGAHA